MSRVISLDVFSLISSPISSIQTNKFECSGKSFNWWPVTLPFSVPALVTLFFLDIWLKIASAIWLLPKFDFQINKIFIIK